jgi:putative photosynthetic complex assembly protein
MAKLQYRAALPKPILISAGLMMVTAMVFAVVSKRLPAGTERPAWAPSSLADEAAARESRDLLFEDRVDGSVQVIDAVDGRPIATFEPGTNGFARIVLRGMAKERLGMGGDRDQAFRLRRTEEGGLALGDPETGREVHLTAFGEASVQAFEHLLTAGISDR